MLRSKILIVFILILFLSEFSFSEVVSKDNKDFIGSFYSSKSKVKEDSKLKDSNRFIFGKYKEDRESYYKNERNKQNLDRYKSDLDSSYKFTKLKFDSLVSLSELKQRKFESILSYNLKLKEMDYKKKLKIKKDRDLEQLFIHMCSFSSVRNDDMCNSFVEFKYLYLKEETRLKNELKPSSVETVQSNKKPIKKRIKDERNGSGVRTVPRP